MQRSRPVLGALSAFALAAAGTVVGAPPAAGADSDLVGGIVFQRSTPIAEFSSVFDLFARTADGTVRRLTDANANGEAEGFTGYGFAGPVPEKGGNRVAAVFFEGPSTQTAVVVTVASGAVTDLSASCGAELVSFGMGWLADGRVLLSGLDRTAPMGAYRSFVATPGGTCQELAQDLFGDTGDLAVSPDGTRVAYSVFGTGGSGDQLWVAAADGSGARAITTPEQDVEQPAWSPDGTRLAVMTTSGDDFRVATLTVPAEGTVTPTVVPEIAAGAGTPSFTPDGQGLAFFRNNAEFRSDGLFQLRDGAVTRLTEARDISPAPVLSDGSQPPPAAPPAPRSIDGACPPGETPPSGFTDVPAGSTHQRAIDCVVWWKVANGRTATTYDPGAPVTRDAMAAFVARAIDAAAPGKLPASAPNAFTDDDGSVHHDSINRLAAANVVGGTGGGLYSPGRVVTRGQMARFLANAAELVLGAPLPVKADYFRDDDGNLFEADINRVAGEGITGGRDDGTYVPNGQVLRDQMGSFLARTLDLFVEKAGATRPS